MRICPECGSKDIQEEGEIVCRGCGLVLKERDIVTQRIQDNFNMLNREWEDPKTPTRRYDRWVADQKDIAQKVGIPHSPATTEFLQTKRCELCGKRSNPQAHLPLCPEHTKEYRKYYMKMYRREKRGQK